MSQQFFFAGQTREVVADHFVSAQRRFAPGPQTDQHAGDDRAVGLNLDPLLTVAEQVPTTQYVLEKSEEKLNCPSMLVNISDDFRRYVAQMQPKLPDLFTFIPGSPVTVEAIPDFQAAMATHYQTGTPDGKRPGRIVVATSSFAERSLIDDEATAYHEGIPGHHMQLSVAQKLVGLPKFRQHSQNSGYIEGWALYAEQLGKEVGF